jgi:hypothetical protein
MALAPNVFVNDGATTFKVAVAAGAEPPMKVNAEVVFTRAPAAGAVTVAKIEHSSPADNAPPDKATDVDVTVTVPPQPVKEPRIDNPLGMVSVKATPLIVDVVELSIVRTIEVVAPGRMVAGANSFVNVTCPNAAVENKTTNPIIHVVRWSIAILQGRSVAPKGSMARLPGGRSRTC